MFTTHFFQHTAPPIPVVVIVASSDSAVAGESLKLTCSATVVPDNLIIDPILTWSRPGVDQIGVEESIETASNLSLTFSPLYTSHGGVYVCSARLTNPEAGVDVTGIQMTTINVQSKLMIFSK